MLFFLIHIDKLFCVSYKYLFLVDSGPQNFFKTKVGHDYKKVKNHCFRVLSYGFYTTSVNS